MNSMMLSKFEEIINNINNINNNNNIQTIKEEIYNLYNLFINNYNNKRHIHIYYQCVNILWDNIAVNWLVRFSEEEKVQYFDAFFLNRKFCIESVIALTSCWRRKLFITNINYQLHKWNIQLLQTLLLSDSQQLLIISQQWKQYNNDIQDEFLKCIINIPQIIANVMQMQAPKFISPNNWYSNILILLIESMDQKDEDTLLSVYEFGGNLCNYISSAGYTNIIIDCLLTKHISLHILNHMKSEAIEKILPHLLHEFHYHGEFVNILLKVFDEKWLSLYILVKTMNIDILYRLIDVAYFKSPHILEEFFCKLVENWCSDMFIKHVEIQRQLNISKLIVYIIRILAQINLFHREHSSMIKLMEGVQKRLSNTIQDCREHGMLVATAFAIVVDPEHELDFQQTLPNVPQPNYEWYNNENNNENKHESKYDDNVDKQKKLVKGFNVDKEFEKTEEYDPNAPFIVEEDSDYDSWDDDDDDDDDDSEELEPLHDTNMNNQTSFRKHPIPVYPRDCLAYLRSNIEKEPELVEIGLECCENIIRNPHPISIDVIEAFAITLIHLSGALHSLCEYEKFEQFRMQSLIALAAKSADIVVPILTRAFYNSNQTMPQRLSILEILHQSAKELSEVKLDINTNNNNNNNNNNNQTHTLLRPINTSNSIYNTNDNANRQNEIDRIINERVAKKTRHITKTHQPTQLYMNKLQPIIGMFFWPLIKQADNWYGGRDLMGTNAVILANLLSTLAAIVRLSGCVSLDQNTRQICRTLIDLTLVCRFHDEGAVRRGCLLCMDTVITIVPTFVLYNDYKNDIMEIIAWLIETVKSDAHADCRHLAQLGLSQLQKGLRIEAAAE